MGSVEFDTRQYLERQACAEEWFEADAERYRTEAREDLIEKLLEGKTVHRCNERDVFDCAINTEGHQGIHGILDLLAGVLALNNKGGDDFLLAARALADEARGFVEAFVGGKPDWIEERAEEIAADAYEDQGSEA